MLINFSNNHNITKNSIRSSLEDVVYLKGGIAIKIYRKLNSVCPSTTYYYFFNVSYDTSLQINTKLGRDKSRPYNSSYPQLLTPN